MGFIKAIVKRPDEPIGHAANISGNLEALQKNVGGYIEAVTISPYIVVLCNEEGRLLDLPYNCTIDGIDFFGTLVFLGANGEEFCDIPLTRQEYIKRFFKN